MDEFNRAVPPARLPPPPAAGVAVLVSGGLDCAVLLGESLTQGPPARPIYVRGGLSWEGDELRHLRRFLDAVGASRTAPLHVLDMPVSDLHADHWSVTGRGVPDAASPDAAVYLPGRNVLLLAKALVWCHLHGVPVLALAVLAGNPFPDATEGFFESYQNAVNRATGGAVEIRRPYARLTKAEVIRRGRGLPLELTFSCIRPRAGRHCGACNKCAERRRAFAAAGVPDPTAYAAEDPCTA
jgi:7-cyano-7-deazaguanine synthase